MKITSNILILSIIISMTSCDILTQVASSVPAGDTPLTSQQVAQGLKEALKVGAEKAVQQLNRTDGYLLDPLMKIELPPQTAQVVEFAQRVPGLDRLVDDLVVRINRSAEDAAAMAKPILVNAITSMTIGDAWGILRGPDTAATFYLREKTFSPLVDTYKPVIKTSLDKPLVAGVSASKTWDEVTGKWNKFANSIAGRLLDVKPLNMPLEEYVTAEALKGMFVKIEEQEKKIRTDISARTSDLLKKVFAQQ